jgi:RNA polymerase sigma factor (sigma-70 family)
MRRGQPADGRAEEPADPELLRRMRLGDESALEALYVRYGGLVFTLALRIVGDPELAREVLQDTFLRSWDRCDTYDSGRGRVPWWLMGIARNRAVDVLRSRPHQARLREQERLRSSTHVGEPAGPGGVDAVLSHAVIQALQGLSARSARRSSSPTTGGSLRLRSRGSWRSRWEPSRVAPARPWNACARCSSRSSTRLGSRDSAVTDEHMVDDLAAYALGSLEETERARVEAPPRGLRVLHCPTAGVPGRGRFAAPRSRAGARTARRVGRDPSGRQRAADPARAVGDRNTIAELAAHREVASERWRQRSSCS